MLPFLERLSQDGHEVVVFDATAEEKSMIPASSNVSTIHVHIPMTDAIRDDKKDFFTRIWLMHMHSPLIGLVWTIFAKPLDLIIDVKSEQLAEALTQHWDLLLLDGFFAVHAYGIAHILKSKGVPYVMFSTSLFESIDTRRQSLGQNWVSEPNMFTPLPADSTDKYDAGNFVDRTVNVLEHTGESLALQIAEQLTITPPVRRLGVVDFSLDKLFQRASFSISDAFDVIGAPLSRGPDIMYTGVACAPPQQLPKEYLDFVEDPASKGTILVAFGTYVNWTYAPPRVRQAFFDALNEMTRYRIIFSYNGIIPEKINGHVKVARWAPQRAILAHPTTKAFLTHGGLKSLREALCTKTPVVLTPIFAEQAYNAKLVLSMGIGTVLNKYYVTKQDIISSVEELIHNPAYSDRIARLHDVVLDRVVPALDEASFYVSRLARRKDRALFFERKGMHQSLFEYHFFDTFALLLLVVHVVAK
ncbi:UGT-63 protein [Aphelenchoides avenae]|nr:UGT-63 protein [Aphelenchus avenae]